ncbi:hypothetical protein RRG08_065571 [Elysia crispata]|uniref:non-specific serine/threonine protein kinase n=1 Tax=Elysia crispata TaxID=231223 RepID=A0AAE0YMQ1_9GAST|nr:hypothetical protein RRG08_065571 [Elysia crispata]
MARRFLTGYITVKARPRQDHSISFRAWRDGDTDVDKCRAQCGLAACPNSNTCPCLCLNLSLYKELPAEEFSDTWATTMVVSSPVTAKSQPPATADRGGNMSTDCLTGQPDRNANVDLGPTICNKERNQNMTGLDLSLRNSKSLADLLDPPPSAASVSNFELNNSDWDSNSSLTLSASALSTGPAEDDVLPPLGSLHLTIPFTRYSQDFSMAIKQVFCWVASIKWVQSAVMQLNKIYDPSSPERRLEDEKMQHIGSRAKREPISFYRSLLSVVYAVALTNESKRTEPHYDEEEEEEEEILGSDDDEQEDPRDYCKGGYHPVKIGDLLNSRYHIVRKLGWGHFSTVWLSWDIQSKRFVALKVVKSAQHYTETAIDEIKLLKCVREADEADPHREKAVQLLDDFKISGVNGTHVCMVFEVLGNNLLKLIIRSNYQGIPLHNVKLIIKQVLEGLDYLHTKCKIIHTDIKPENILMCVDDVHIRKLAADAIEFQRMGLKLPGSAVSTAPKEKPQDFSKMSKNKKKKMKKKQKKQEQLIQIQLQQLEELDREKGSDKATVRKLNEGSDHIETSPSLNSLQRMDTENALPSQDVRTNGSGGAGDHPTKLVNGQHSENASSNEKNKDKPCSEQIQEGQENKVNDIKKGLESTALANSTNNAIQNDEEEEEEQDNDSSNLNKSSGSESHAAGIARLNVTGENSHVVETNNATAEGSADSSLPQSSTNLTSNAVVPPSEPLCNGHSQQETHTRHPTDGVTKNLASTGKQESGSPEDPASPGFQLEAEQVSTPPAGNGAQANAEQCWENSTRLVNSVSLDLESCDGEVEDMQTDGVSEEVVSSTRKPDPVHEICDVFPVKIADLGNACWTYHQFTEDIQTRQYRCLEVLIGAGYDTPADIWSTACMAFELATGDYLFEPHSGEDYTRDEDHLAHIIELVGPIPRHIALCGKYSREFFNRRGELRHISKLKPWGLVDVLTEKYEWSEKDARDFSDFLLPMLAFDPSERATAAECLKHPWLVGMGYSNEGFARRRLVFDSTELSENVHEIPICT